MAYSQRCAQRALIAYADEPRVRTGDIFIGMPDYNKLISQRLQISKLKRGPPYVPLSFAKLVNATDPAMSHYTSRSPKQNPYWGKHIFTASGGADPLVPFDLSREFLRKLVLGKGATARNSLSVFIQPQTPHFVTTESV